MLNKIGLIERKSNKLKTNIVDIGQKTAGNIKTNYNNKSGIPVESYAKNVI